MFFSTDSSTCGIHLNAKFSNGSTDTYIYITKATDKDNEITLAITENEFIVKTKQDGFAADRQEFTSLQKAIEHFEQQLKLIS